MNEVHGYDEEECLFQNYEFHGPGSGVLVLGQGLKYYILRTELLHHHL